jgi:hypothetical protein
MVIASTVGALTDAFKAIKVELTLKAGELGLTKEPRHNVGDKATGLVNGKGTPMGKEGKDIAAAI